MRDAKRGAGDRLIIAAILFLGLALRLGRLTFQPLWADEGYSIYFASLDPVTLAAATAADIHPPLYYYLLKAWMVAFGPGDFAVRLLSVCCGVLTIGLAYRLAGIVAGRWVGLAAALFLALSPFHVYFSQEVRMYALAGSLATASTLCMVKAIGFAETRRGGRLTSVLYVVITALALYTLYYSVFLLVAQTVYILAAYRRQRAVIARWLVMQALVVVLYLPWIVGATGALASYVAGKVAVEHYAPLDALRFFGQVIVALSMGAPSPGQGLLALGALPVAGLAVLGVRGQQPTRHAETQPGPLLACLVVIPLVLGFAVNLLWPFSPTGFQRLFLCYQPFLLILAARGLMLLGERRRVGAIAVGLACALFAAGMLASFYALPRYERHDYRPLVRDMATLAHPDDVVIALYPWQLGFVRSYFAGDLPALYLVQSPVDWAGDAAVMRRDLDHLAAEHRRLWFPAYEGAGGLLEGAITTYLTDAAFPALLRWYGDHRLLLYASGDLGPTSRRLATEGLVLESVRTSLEPLAAGRDCVRVDVRWRAVGTVPAQGQVALRIVDDMGRQWAGRDSAPRNGSYPFSAWPAGATVADRHAVAIPVTTPPGSYRLVFSVFERERGRNLDLSDVDGRSLGSEVEIATVVVTKSTYAPPVKALGLANPLQERFTGGPRLIGVTTAETIRPGQRVALDLYWQVETAIPDDLVLFVQARDRVNKLWGLYEGPAVGMQYPTSRWVVGDILRSQVSFLLAPDAPGGEYDLYVGWLRGRKMERLAVARGGNEVAVAHVVAVSRQHVMALPQPSKPMDVRLGESVQLLGIDAEREVVQPGANANLTLYWRCLARMETAYSVFVHVVDGRGNIQAQIDSEPVEGKIPTTSWLPGEVVADRLQIRIPLGLPAGSYAVIGGMYDRVTGKRLRAQNAAGGSGGDAIELGQIVVAGP